MRRLWSLKWDNHFKEVYWRLVLNGLPTAARMHNTRACGVCQQLPPQAAADTYIGRRHHFWECPVAQSVVAAIQQQLPASWCAEPLAAHHVVFMHRPRGASRATTLHCGVWRVVCLAAVCAMNVGRGAACEQAAEDRRAAAEQADAQQEQRQQRGLEAQRRITAMLPPAALLPHQLQHQQMVRQHQDQQQQQQAQQLAQQAQQLAQQQQQAAAAHLTEVQQQAVAQFWELLQDFVVVRAAPRAWLAAVAPDHPFLRVSPGLGGLSCLVVAPH
jgi:hypothetical protein